MMLIILREIRRETTPEIAESVNLAFHADEQLYRD
jgi:hypothetical protein